MSGHFSSVVVVGTESGTTHFTGKRNVSRCWDCQGKLKHACDGPNPSLPMILPSLAKSPRCSWLSFPSCLEEFWPPKVMLISLLPLCSILSTPINREQKGSVICKIFEKLHCKRYGNRSPVQATHVMYVQEILQRAHHRSSTSLQSASADSATLQVSNFIQEYQEHLLHAATKVLKHAANHKDGPST